METMTVGTLIAAFEEMFGAGLFWGLVAGADGAVRISDIALGLRRGERS